MAEGRRTNLCRFGGLPHAIVKHVDQWDIDCFERSWVSLELDMLGNKKLLKQIVLTEQQQASENVGESSGTTSTARVGLDEKVLRDCCQNGMAISVMVLQDKENKRKAYILSVLSSCILLWHTKQNRELRCSDASLEFWEGQATGGYLAHLNSFLDVLKDPMALERCGFACSKNEAVHLGPDMQTENEFAELLGDQQAVACGCRAKRHMQTICGWPQMWLGARDPAAGQGLAEKFLQDLLFVCKKKTNTSLHGLAPMTYATTPSTI